MKAFLIGALIISILALLIFLWARIEETIGVGWIYIVVFFILASFLFGNIAIELFGL